MSSTIILGDLHLGKKHNVTWFVDDAFRQFTELTQAGICCFLFRPPQNARHYVGHKAIEKLSELPLVSAL